MPAVRNRKGTHAKGSCEPGQAGRCSHKQRTLVQWTSLLRRPAAGAFFRVSFVRTTPMAKRKPSASPDAEAPASAEYTVLARRYRPQQFADVVGQEPVTRALINALESNRVAHAYLFTGARGVGKTSTARILAKALNCVQGPTATPC